MAKIKVGKLRDLVKDEIEILKHKGLEVEIKRYLPIEKKLELALSVYSSCVDDDNGLKTINGNSKDIALVYYIAKYYTNINLPRDIFEAYDIFMQTGLYTGIEHIIHDEIIKIEEIISNIIAYEKERYHQENQLVYVVKQALQELADKLPTVEESENLIKEFKKEMDDLDLNKLNFVKDFVSLNKGK